MYLIEPLVLVLFLAIVGLMIWGPIERAIIGGVGVAIMVLIGAVSPSEAFEFVDWNILAILVGLWIVSSYLVKAKMPEALISFMLKRTKSLKTVIFALVFSAGMVTMFVDNVLVVLLFCPIVLTICRRLNLDPLLPTVMTGLAANFMGVGLLLGDITPQMLHSIAGFEFMDFVVFNGKPSSFFVLLSTFLIVLLIYFKRIVKLEYKGDVKALLTPITKGLDENKGLLRTSVFFFIAIIVLMCFRRALGVPLGAIAFLGAIVTASVIEVLNRMRKLQGAPSFADVLSGLEWRAVFYYAFLFMLVGSIGKAGYIRAIADALRPFLTDIRVGLPILYWVSAGVASIVQFDAYNLVMFQSFKEYSLTTNLNVWPYYWSVAWAATLASEATLVSAPALYVTWTLIEKEGYKVTTKAFHSITVKFAIITLLVNFALTFILFAVF